MRRIDGLSAGLGGMVFVCAAGAAWALGPAPPRQAFSAAGDRTAIVRVMTAVADWQLANPSQHEPYDWTQAAFYTGHDGVRRHHRQSEVRRRDEGDGGAEPVAARALVRGTPTTTPSWRPTRNSTSGTRTRRCWGRRSRSSTSSLTRRFDDPLVWGGGIENRELAWCDALFMGPPAMAAVSASTGDRRYLDLADRLWWKTTDYLYDRTEHLYYRDSRYFDQREKNGRKVFWSRGNGWVIAGLARMLQDMPADYPWPRPIRAALPRHGRRRARGRRARTATGARACSTRTAGRTPRPAARGSSCSRWDGA